MVCKGFYSALGYLMVALNGLAPAKKTLLFFSLAAGSLLLIQGCDTAENKTERADIQLEKLSKTWKLSQATLDGVPQTGYESFTLAFSGSSGQSPFDYITTNRPTTSPWPVNGKCTFDETNPESKMTRDPSEDAVPMTYSVADGKLRVSFVFSGAGYEGGLVLNVRGSWVFEFTQ